MSRMTSLTTRSRRTRLGKGKSCMQGNVVHVSARQRCGLLSAAPNVNHTTPVGVVNFIQGRVGQRGQERRTGMNVRRSRPAAAASNRRRVRAPRGPEPEHRAPPAPGSRHRPAVHAVRPSRRAVAAASCRFPSGFQFQSSAAPAWLRACGANGTRRRHGRACLSVRARLPTSFPAGFVSTRSGGRNTDSHHPNRSAPSFTSVLAWMLWFVDRISIKLGGVEWYTRA